MFEDVLMVVLALGVLFLFFIVVAFIKWIRSKK